MTENQELYIPYFPNYQLPVDPDYAGAIVTSIATSYLIGVVKLVQNP